MEVSVILTAYEDTPYLEKAIWGYFKQSYQDFELLVADDGHGPDPSDRLERLSRETALAIRHLRPRQPSGRTCGILNDAIQAAAGTYLIFSEDRCIPRWDFVETHLRLARPGLFLSGGCVSLHAQVSRQIDREVVITGRATDPAWLFERGLEADRRTRILSLRPRWARLRDLLAGTRVEWNSANSSCWRDDLLAVNGFDERIYCGALDRELGQRLSNAGIRGKSVLHRAVCVRLCGHAHYTTREPLERNLSLSDQSRRSGATWTPFGICKGYRIVGEQELVQAAAEDAQDARSRRAVA